MARKRKETQADTPPPSVRRGGRKPSGKPRLPTRLSIKGSDAWDDWIGRFSASECIPRTKLIDEALRVYAAVRKFDPPPSREDA